MRTSSRGWEAVRRLTDAQHDRPSGSVYPLRQRAESAGLSTPSSCGPAGAGSACAGVVADGARGESPAQPMVDKARVARQYESRRARMQSSRKRELLDTMPLTS